MFAFSKMDTCCGCFLLEKPHGKCQLKYIFCRTKIKKKRGELTKWRRHFLLEKHLDGNGSRSSKARSNAWLGADFTDWEKHSTGGPKWDGNGSFWKMTLKIPSLKLQKKGGRRRTRWESGERQHWPADCARPWSAGSGSFFSPSSPEILTARGTTLAQGEGRSNPTLKRFH